MTVASFTKTGSKSTSSQKLPSAIFGLKVTDHSIIKLAYESYLANARLASASTQSRGMVRGGGRKPWRQKGTGRARAGSIRSPLWRGGAVTFGPTGEQNFIKKLPTQTKRLALRQALSLKVAAKAVSVIEKLESTDGKTASMDKLMAKLGEKRSVLLVVADKEAKLVRSTNNLPYASLINASYLNVYEVMNAKHIVFSSDSLKVIEDWLGSK